MGEPKTIIWNSLASIGLFIIYRISDQLFECALKDRLSQILLT